MYLRPYLRWVRSYFPRRLRPESSISARSCYTIWLRHLIHAARCGRDTMPRSVAELGPGSSQGVGLAALLCGSSEYTSLDVVDYRVDQRNAVVLEELIELFRSRADVPGPDEFPRCKPLLDSYAFPSDVLTDDRLRTTLDASRLDAIRAAVRSPGQTCDGIRIRHVAPWTDENALPPASVDLVLSQAVLMLVPDLEGAYRAMVRWLRPGGFMSHQIDYSSLRMSRQWNGHWAYSDWLWRLLRGKHVYYSNRAVHSTHLGLMRRHGLDVLYEVKAPGESGISRRQLAKSFRHLTDDDLATRGAFILAAARPTSK